MNRDILVVKCALLLIANFADTSHSNQFFCLWFMKNWRYYFNFWFICSIYPYIWGYNDVDSFISIPNILFNSLVIFTANYEPLSDIILSSNLYNFHTLSLNNLATKCVILDNLSQITRIASFPATNDNFVINSTIRYIYSFSGNLLNFNFPTSLSAQFFILWHILYSSTYFPISLVTPGYWEFLITNSVIFHFPSYSATSTSWYNLPSTLYPLVCIHFSFSILDLPLSTITLSSLQKT